MTGEWVSHDLGAVVIGREAIAPFAERKAHELLDDLRTYVERVADEVAQHSLGDLRRYGLSAWVSFAQGSRLMAPAFCLTGDSVWEKLDRNNIWFVNTGKPIPLHRRDSHDGLMKIQAIFTPPPGFPGWEWKQKNIVHEVYGV